MSNISDDWNPRRQKQAKKMLELRRLRSEAWQESTEATEEAFEAAKRVGRYLPWLVGSAAALLCVAILALGYGVYASMSDKTTAALSMPKQP